MKNTFMVIPFVLLCCFAVGCQQGAEVVEEPVADVEAETQAIKDIVKEAEAAFEAADIDELMSFFSDDAVRIAPNELALIGKEAIRNRAQDVLDSETFEDEWTVENVHFSGNLAVALLTWSTIATPKDGGEPFESNGNWIMIFKKNSGDAWKLSYSIWSDVGLIYPEQAE